VLGRYLIDICVLYHLVLCFTILLCLCNPASNAAILNKALIKNSHKVMCTTVGLDRSPSDDG